MCIYEAKKNETARGCLIKAVLLLRCACADI